MILEKTLPLILIFILGFLLRKKKILKKEDSTVLSKLILYIVLPSIVIKAFAGVNIEGKLIYLPLAGLIVVLSLTLSGYLLSYILRLKGRARGSFIIAFPTFEGGLIGYAFMIAAFGELGLSRLILFDIANGLFVFTVIYFISCYIGKGEMNIKKGVLKFLKTPVIWALFIGIIFNIVKFHNGLVFSFLDMVGGSVLFLVMLFIGLEFQPSISSLKLPSITIFLKLTLGLLLGYLVSLLFGFDGLERIAIIVWVSLPPSVMILPYSKENNLDIEYSANLLSIALPFSILFMLVLLNFL